MAATTECSCGSGLPFSRCHGDSRNEYARAQALREADSLAWMFPFVRVSGIDPLVEDAAERVGPDEIPDIVVDDVFVQISLAERRRVVDLWAIPYADRWESLVTTSGDPAAAEQAVVKGAVRAAIAECQATPSDVLEPLEHHRPRPLPIALAVVIPPELVWSIDEARAGVAAADGRRRSIERMDSVEAVAYALMSFEHVKRTRTLAARLGRELPLSGSPGASRVLAEACAEVASALEAARGATAALLIAYSQQLAAVETASAG